MSSKIGIYEFNMMTFDEQAEVLWERGVFLTNIKEAEGIRANLYRLNDFYVEALFSSLDSNTFTFHTFKQGERLEKYLDRIDVAKLF